jgi:hypothetical protein
MVILNSEGTIILDPTNYLKSTKELYSYVKTGLAAYNSGVE